MTAKKFFVTALKPLAVCIAIIVSFVSALGIANSGMTSASQSTEDAAQAGIALFIVSIVNALLLSWPIARSRWQG